MPETLTLALDTRFLSKEGDLRECIDNELARRKAIRVMGESVVFDPKYMTVGHFYCLDVKGKPYLYRKLNGQEIEVYGLAEET